MKPNQVTDELREECLRNAVKSVRVRVRWGILNTKKRWTKTLYDRMGLRMQREQGCTNTLIVTPELDNVFGLDEYNGKTLACKVDVTYKKAHDTHIQDIIKYNQYVVAKIPSYRLRCPV